MVCHTLLPAKGSNFIVGRSSLRCVQNHIRSPGNPKGIRRCVPFRLMANVKLPDALRLSGLHCSGNLLNLHGFVGWIRRSRRIRH
ncbi:hypothetical protein DXV24_03300 [Escherichia albertii]|nr:hypothetical protein [Escherichia albertii]EFX6075598.1 hypothetical protein [Shigella boydii]